MTRDEPMVPKRLALFLMAVGQKLNGEQLRECIEGARNGYGEPSLNSWETNVAEWIMADDAMAEQYVAEHRAGLEKLQDLQRKCQYALERLVVTEYRSDWTIVRELENIKREADCALKYINDLRDATELKP